MSRRAYTLIELLVVMAIVAALVALTTVGIGALRSSAENVRVQIWRQQRTLGQPAPRFTPLRIYFVGNSYTSAHDLMGMLHSLVKQSGVQPQIEVVDGAVVPGHTLEQNWNEGVAAKAIDDKEWDFVVLQEQSLTPIYNRPPMMEYGELFGNAIKEKNGIPLFYLTWSREWAPQLQPAYNDAYTLLARSVKGEVAPAGMAWALCRSQNPEIKLYDVDGSHPSVAGTYLTACSFFAAIYMKSPEGLMPLELTYANAPTAGFTPEQARIMQKHAWQAYLDVRKHVYDKGVRAIEFK